MRQSVISEVSLSLLTYYVDLDLQTIWGSLAFCVTLTWNLMIFSKFHFSALYVLSVKLKTRAFDHIVYTRFYLTPWAITIIKNKQKQQKFRQ